MAKGAGVWVSCSDQVLRAMKKYNVGIIGYGWAAGAHIAAINFTSL
jgi:hypothetical protein